MAKALSFEDKLLRIEEIAEEMQNSELPLGESVSLYEEGVKLIKELRKELSAAEEKVKILSALCDQPVLKDYE
ncbi:MAG: exodeoxyribonuclease VII small subunit [Eubacteriaceae bacterium]|nr:exodeoxyribonuclease VII small subunit [Eubacteriaceae bacterium]